MAAGISVSAVGNNLRHIRVVLLGPEDTVYKGGVFFIEAFLPKTYPIEPPRIQVLTKIYHPNIDKLGRICLDCLQRSEWKYDYSLRSVLVAIQCLLHSQVLDDAVSPEIAEHWRTFPADAERRAIAWTLKFSQGQKENNVLPAKPY